MSLRQLSPLDFLVLSADRALHSIAGGQAPVTRPSPAAAIQDAPPLEEQEQREAGRLMRVNHAGEIAAQALYQGQALTARRNAVRTQLRQAADEEADHLAWCEDRIENLGTHISYLSPLWYGGSLAIGALAGLAGDPISLGFLAETERQVEAHIDGHLERLPEADTRSRAVLAQMKIDEAGHRDRALNAGGKDLPAPIQRLMRATAKVMTRSAYWL